MDDSGGERHKGPAHVRKRNLPRENANRLAEIGRLLPPSSEEDLQITAGLRASRLRRRLLKWGSLIIVVALGAGAIAQWVRPLPHDVLNIPGVRLSGATPSFAWPRSGESAATVMGVGSVGQLRGTRSVPVAGLTEVLTAYVVLSTHHLSPGATGPLIHVNANTLAAYRDGSADHEYEVPVVAGESLTELQALEGLLVDSGADMATLLADWDAGSVSAFVAKMNVAATTLGLSSTHITDPSGAEATTTSTAENLVNLGEASLTIPVLRQIVSLGQASVPKTSIVYNLNFDLGQNGIIGIKTASNSNAQGFYLFAARQVVDGNAVTVVGDVLSQPGGALGPNTAAVDAGDALVKSIFSALQGITLYVSGQKVGEVRASWGSRVPVIVTRTVKVVGWPGLVVSLALRRRPLVGALTEGTTVGVLEAHGDRVAQGELRLASALRGPGVWWRLTR